MGGDGGAAHQGGSGGRYGYPPGYEGWPKEVWSPTGGWYCHPVKWRRNTALTLLGIILIAIPIGRWGAAREVRPHPPIRPVPSELWADKRNWGPPLDAPPSSSKP